MKNTLVELDMVYIDENGFIVGLLRNAPPLTRDPRAIGKVSRFVLELDGGFCARHKVAAGQRVDMVFHST